MTGSENVPPGYTLVGQADFTVGGLVYCIIFNNDGEIMNEEELIAVGGTRVIQVNVTTFASTEEAACYYPALVDLFG